MRSLVGHLRSGWRQLMSRVQTQYRVDDQSKNERLDLIWRAECEEMDVILRRKYGAKSSEMIVQPAEYFHEKTE